MNCIVRTILLIFCAMSVQFVCAGEPVEAFDLEVRLQDIYNPDFSVLTLIRFNEPFVVRASNGKVTNIFWGELHPPKDGKYQLELAIYEWESPKSYIGNPSPALYQLKLGESQTGGPVMSSVYFRTVTLRRHEAQ